MNSYMVVRLCGMIEFHVFLVGAWCAVIIPEMRHYLAELIVLINECFLQKSCFLPIQLHLLEGNFGIAVLMT